MCTSKVNISRDALRMRLKRICEKKKTGRMWVSLDIHEDYTAGGEKREQLELALLETLKGLGDGVHRPDKIRAGCASVWKCMPVCTCL